MIADYPSAKLFAATVLGFVVSMPLLAQDSKTPPVQDSASESRLLEEIIVTATRREADVQTVPLSVHVITEEALARLGAANFADYARIVPGLTFTDIGVGGENQTIRGISTNVRFEVNPTTGLYLDEVPITTAGGTGAPYSPDPMLVDIERIEILRGPQGTLFGASAMGGAIRIITRQPNLSQTERSVGGLVSSIKNGSEGYDLHGMINTPLNDGQAAIRAVGYYRDMGGYIDNLSNGVNDINNSEILGGRLSGTVVLSDRVSLTGRIAYQDRKSDGNDIEELDEAPRTQSRLDEANEDEWTNFNLVVNADLGWGRLISSTSFLDRTVDTRIDISVLLDAIFAISNPLTVVNKDDVNEFVQEIRIVSNGDDRLTWLAGIFYQDQDLDFDQNFPSPGFDAITGGLASMFGPPDNLFVGRSNFTLEQIALFGELSYEITDRLDFVAGLRWFDIDRDFKSNNIGLLFAGNPSESGSTSESDVTPKFSLSYAASDNLNFYGTIANGFRSGGVNPPEGSMDPACLAELAALGFSEFPIGYDSDSLWNYELGAKSRWIDGRVQLNAALYHIDWSDMQTFKVLNCGINFTENVGKAVIDGVEFDLVALPTDNVVINIGASYTNAELRNDVPNLGGSAGDRIPGVPRFTANLGVSYFFPVFGDREAFIHGDYQHVSNSYNVFDQTVRRELPAYDITNIRIGLNTQHWSSALFINNLFDERGILIVEDDILGQWVTATPPLTIGVSATWTF